MKKCLILLVVLLAEACLMAAMAYTNTSITNDASFAVSNTNNGLLALEPGDHAAVDYADDYNSSNHSSPLVINLAKGYGGEFGVQKGSIYTWEKLFKVINKSEKPIVVSIYIPAESVNMKNCDMGSDLKFRADTDIKTTDWILLAGSDSTQYHTLKFILKVGREAWIDTMVDSMKKDIPNGIRKFKLVVSARFLDEDEGDNINDDKDDDENNMDNSDKDYDNDKNDDSGIDNLDDGLC